MDRNYTTLRMVYTLASKFDLRWNEETPLKQQAANSDPFQINVVLTFYFPSLDLPLQSAQRINK